MSGFNALVNGISEFMNPTIEEGPNSHEHDDSNDDPNPVAIIGDE